MSRESPLHEGSGIRLRGMIWFFVWFFIAMIIVHILVFGFYKLRVADAEKMNVPITALDREKMRTVPPEPRLQPSRDHDQLPRIDMQQLRERELEDFKRRGWVSDDGKVRVPDAIAGQVVQMSQSGPATRSSR